MSLSLLTNVAAMTALQTLNKTQKNLNETQSRISTGLKVGTAKDNAATWAITTTMKSDVTGFKAITENLSLTSSTVATARGATEQVTKLIDQIKGKVTSAENSAVDKGKVQSDIDALVGQINSIVSGSQFNGVNLINSTGTYRALASLDRTATGVNPNYIDIENHDLRIAGGGLAMLDNISVLDRGTTLLGAKASATGVIAGTNATSDMEATKQVMFSSTGGYTANDVTFTYVDKAGANQTITVTSVGGANTDVVNALNSSSEFKANFYAEAGLTGNDIRIMAKDRDTGSKVTITSLGGPGVTAGLQTAAASSTGTAMSFQDGAPIKDGEVIEVAYNVNGSNFTVKLQSADAVSGTLLGVDDKGNKILALDSQLVSAWNVTGTQIADEVRAALTGAYFGGTSELQTAGVNHFAVGGAATAAGANGAAVDGQTIGLSANGSANLFMSTVDGTDAVHAFTLPVNDYAAVLDKVESALTTATAAAAAFGSAQSRLDTQKEFMTALTDAMNTGIGDLVDADMTEESARLQALQVQSQLGVQALSIANQSPQSILSLFK